MSLSVYIAGSSRELELCDGYRKKLWDAGISCTSDWIDAIRKNASVGRTDADLSLEEMRSHSERDLECIQGSHVVWMMAHEQPSVGSWIELGYSIATRGHTLIVSGSWRRSIFTSLAYERFDSHDDALAWVLSKR